MNRVVMWSVLVGLAAMYTPASAMEFGQVRVRSGLDQPLLAEVPLLPQRAGELDRIQIGLASAAEFSHAGLDAAAASLPLQFSLHEAGGGRQVLQISSPQPLHGAYLDVLLALNGPQGRSLHELPIVLDPNGRRVAAAGGAGKSARTAGDGREVHTLVQSGQTLTSIALAHRLPGASLDQMLLAYQQANPQAFYAGNISALKAGAILRQPTRSEVEAVSRAAAFQAVTQQNQSWHAGRPRRPGVLADAAAPAPAAPAPAAAPREDRLALLAGHGQPQAAQRGSLAQEALRTSQQQAAELGSRIHDLEVMQQERERLIALKSQQIAELQRQLQAAQAKAAPSPAPAVAPPSASSAPAPAAPAAVAGSGMPVWLWSGLGAAALAALALAMRRRRPTGSAAVPAPVSPPESAPVTAAAVTPEPDPPPRDTEQELARLNARLQQTPDDLDLYFELASLYYARHDVAHFVATAEAMHAQLDPAHEADWADVQHMGRELLPAHPLFAAQVEPRSAPVSAAAVAAGYAAIQAAPVEYATPSSGPEAEPIAAPAPVAEAEFEAEPEPAADPEAAVQPVTEPVLESAPLAEPAPPPSGPVEAAVAAAAVPTPTADAVGEAPAVAPAYRTPDPVDTKLDLARAYLDMQDPASARAMLEEVLDEGSRMQQDVARQLLDGLGRG